METHPTTIILCVVMFLLGTIYTCSQAAFDIKGIWFDFKNGLTTPIFGDFYGFLTDRLMIPVCALGSCLFVGWAWKPQNAIREIELDGKPFRLKKAYSFLVKYLAPISIIIIIVASFATGTTPQLNLLSSGTVSIQERQFSVMGHCLSCILPPLYGKMQDENRRHFLPRCPLKTAGIRPAGRFGFCRNRRLRRRNRLRRFALRAVPPHQTLQRSLPCPKTEIFSEHFPAKTA